MHLLASGLGWKLDRTEDIIEPVIASQEVTTANLTIEPDKALGVNQIGRGLYWRQRGDNTGVSGHHRGAGTT